MIDIFIDVFLKKVAQMFIDELFEYSKDLMQTQETYHLKAIDVSGYSILQLSNVSFEIKNKILGYHHNFRCMIAAAADRMES